MALLGSLELGEGDVVCLKGAMSAIPGGVEELRTVLEATGAKVQVNLTAKTTHVVVSTTWVDASAANRAWVSKAAGRGGVAIVYDTEIAEDAFGVKAGGPVGGGGGGASAASAPPLQSSSWSSSSSSSSAAAAPAPAAAAAAAGARGASRRGSAGSVVDLTGDSPPPAVVVPRKAPPPAATSSVGSDSAGFPLAAKKPRGKKAAAAGGASSSSNAAAPAAAAAASSSAAAAAAPAAAAPAGVPPAALRAASHWDDWQPYAGGSKPWPVAGEKRPEGRWREQPPQDLKARILRASSQRMFLLDRKALGGGGGSGGGSASAPLAYSYQVLGTTGNLYTVTVGPVPGCTCPDAARGHQCKHVLFVLLRFLRVPRDHPLLWQASWLSHELAYMFAHAPDPVRTAALADAAVRRAYAASVGIAAVDFDAAEAAGAAVSSGISSSSAAVAGPLQSGRKAPSADDDCPICLESVGMSLAALSWCKLCRNNFHAVCINQWAAAKRSQGAGPVPCPFCRGAWVNPDAPAAAAGGGGGAAAAGAGVSYSRDGYANFAAVAGLSTRRDTSTYHRPPERYLRGGGRKRGRGRWGYLQYGDYDDDGGDFDEDDYDGDDY